MQAKQNVWLQISPWKWNNIQPTGILCQRWNLPTRFDLNYPRIGPAEGPDNFWGHLRKKAIFQFLFWGGHPLKAPRKTFCVQPKLRNLLTKFTQGIRPVFSNITKPRKICRGYEIFHKNFKYFFLIWSPQVR